MSGRRVDLVLVAVALAIVPGCGREIPKGTVTGKVRYQTTTLSFGTVAFIGSDGRAVSAMIQPDGTYTVQDVSVGLARISVQTYPLPPQVAPPDAPPGSVTKTPQPRYVPIPERYADHNKSGLTYDVQPGAQQHDLVLK
jgi:hypothetical protein